MIQRIRRPGQPAADIDHGPSSAISHRTAAESAGGAVLITQAAVPPERASRAKPDRMTRSEAAKAYWSSLTPEQREERLAMSSMFRRGHG